MKKVLSFAAIASVFAISCTKAENDLMDPSAGRNVIQAVIEDDTRSSVTDGGTFNWTNGDKITLVGADNSNDTYNYVSGNSFTLDGTTPKVTNPTVAYYPASSEHKADKFFLATSYTYTYEDGVSTNAAMIATPPTQGDTYAFRHLGGLMRFNVKNVPVGAESFSFTAVGKKITGDFDIIDGIIKTENSTSADNSVIISFTALTAVQDMTFYVPLPVGKYGDYKVAFSIEGQQDQVSHTSTGVTNTIAPKTLLLMPTFSFDGPNKLDKGNAPAGVIDLEKGNQDVTISGSEGKGAEVVVVPADDKVDAVATLNYQPAANGTSTLSLSDGSADDAVSGESEGNVVVNAAPASGDAATVASLDIDMPTMTVTLQAPGGKTVTYNTVTATTAQNTLIIGQGISVGTLNLNGGNVVIEEGATVGTINNDNGKTITRRVKTKEGLISSIEAVLNGNGAIVEVVNDIADLDADNTITIPNGKTLVLDLNNHTVSGISDQTGANRNMFTVKGTLNVKNGTVALQHAGTNMEWNNSTNVFDVTAGGVLNVDNAIVKNLGGSDMGFCVHLNNWGEVTLNATGTTFESNYVGIRAFNSGPDDNNITLSNCDIITGNSCIWVHNYTADDFSNDSEKAAKAAERLNFSFTDTRISRTSGSISLIRFGFTNAIYYSDIEMSEVVAGTEVALKWALDQGKNVIMNNDIALTSGLTIPADKVIALDLNGKTISQTSDTPVSMITNNGALTIKDSSTNGSGKIEFTFNGTVNNNIAANAISNRGTLVVKGGVISNTGTGNQIGYAIDNYNGSTLTVDGGEISASGSSYYDGIRLFCGSNETTVTVNNGEISTIWAQNPTANKATEVNGTVIINGGTVGPIYYENYTTVKVKKAVTATVTSYGAGSDNTITTVDGEYTVYSFVHNN